MREIKFRAWHNEHESMAYFKNEKLKTDQYQAHHFAALLCGDYGDVLMQFTGLHDKNGTDVYEGDHLLIGKDYLGFVEYKNGAFRVNDSDDNHAHAQLNQERCAKLEVRGSIHENPELLEGEQ